MYEDFLSQECVYKCMFQYTFVAERMYHTRNTINNGYL